MNRSLSLSQARRVAVAAQGLHKVRPATPVTLGAVGRTFARLELIQIDSVNVLSRAQYLPIFSRLGPYAPELLDRLAVRHPRQAVEYWAHEASLVRSEHFGDLVPWQRRKWIGSLKTLDEDGKVLAEQILDLLDTSHAMTSREISTELGHQHVKVNDAWGWNWSVVKRALEALFAEGLIGTEGRNSAFERRYTSLHKVFPKGIPATTSDGRTGMERLLVAAARAHGVGSAHCLADYFRLPLRQSAVVLEELAERSILERAKIAGINETYYLLPDTKIPRKAAGRALLGPFDSMVFNRRRLENLFGFTYRLEIYTPSAKRVYGYYVLPFLLGERLVARVDLKADRSSGRLLVRGSFAEPGAPGDTAVELAAELLLMAKWLGLNEVVVSQHGNLAAALEFSLSSPETGQKPQVKAISHVD
ncbi:winged helix-turn-helix domain-containing protein [Paeniglutamicibacter terrestris]|uniref:Winged helix-turn-helix domain-containing protein n=1 Tax=Paeniglutamicibacter terrestris TaxID=2723403 RepID=A0ABX1G7M6_9MICC|nr:crosslink repair DNA glycosylase YcaQ family protein [Paeniglutamicibacter terrestris]NKG22278.1 winged helix-turn-helix domain-containing protein [Paeniglutamicibacter terrestris]